MSHPLTVPKCRAGNRNSERLSNLGTATQGAEGLWWEPGLPMLLLGVAGMDQSRDSQGNWEEEAGGQGQVSGWG